ncbi:MAG TPA: FAD-dependent monooxygenase [Stellaceae bacterium]|nr:FAD-dependent monooxygenase [Stellaceae bacterium]
MAIRLASLDRRVVVFEARSEAAIREEGAFLTLSPNAMNALRALGCFEAVLAAGAVTTGIEIRNGSGRRLGLIDQSRDADRFGAPSLTIARGEFIGTLIDAAIAAQVELRFSCGLCSVAEDEAAVQLRFTDGTLHRTAIAAAADGLRSTLRRAIFPEYPDAQFTGLIGDGGMVEAPVAPTNGLMRMTFGDEAFFGYLKADGGPTYWFSSYSQPDDRVAAADPEQHAQAVRRLHLSDPPPNSEVLACVRQLPRSYPIYGMPPLPAWSRGRVVLIGDAAHAVGPHAGQGAAMALEDALVLAACLAETPHFAAFGRYEALRRPRIDRVVQLTVRNSAQKRAATPLQRSLRDILMPLLIPLAAHASRKIFAFRADQRPLDPP